jgi:hypothetical protein
MNTILSLVIEFIENRNQTLLVELLWTYLDISYFHLSFIYYYKIKQEITYSYIFSPKIFIAFYTHIFHRFLASYSYHPSAIAKNKYFTAGGSSLYIILLTILSPRIRELYFIVAQI